jgi:sterol desaturase/sphingolipid hydroxylase (fatty acid hydroxylase superfamily)
MNMKKYLRATQMVWLGMAILAMCTTIYMLIIGASDNAIFCLMITLFCGVMWNMRRMFNNRMIREMNKRQEAEKSSK